MPTYEYECRHCGHAFEQFQSIKAPPLTECPVCGKKKVKRLLGAGAGLLFKGSGFYQTDYRSASYQSRASAEKTSKPEAAKATSTTSTSTTAKPTGQA